MPAWQVAWWWLPIAVVLTMLLTGSATAAAMAALQARRS